MGSTIKKAILAASLGLISFNTQANITYTYVSNKYDTFYGVTDSSIVIGDSLFASATFAKDSIKDGSVTPLSWQISDGVNLITSETNSYQTVTFSFLNGSIYKWQYFVYTMIGNSNLDNYALFTYFDGIRSGYDQSLTNLNGQYKSAYINNTPGSWTLQTASVPEPESLAMLFAGLGLLGVAARRNKQA